MIMEEKRSYVSRVLIAPQKAQELLNKNDHNRNITEGRVAYYADLMRRGLWKEESNDMIVIAKDGTVLNGQHRLTAIIRSGITVSMHVLYNAEIESQDIMDTGKPRTLSNVLSIRGEDYTSDRSTCYNLFAKMGISLSEKRKVGIEAQLQFAYLIPAVNKALEVGKTDGRFMKRGLLGTIAVLYHYEGENVLKFYSSIVTGEQLTKQMPAYAFREWFLRAKKRNITPSDVFARLAWDYYNFQGGKKSANYHKASGDNLFLQFCEKLKKRVNKVTPVSEGGV